MAEFCQKKRNSVFLQFRRILRTSDSWKTQISKISWHYPFKYTMTFSIEHDKSVKTNTKPDIWVGQIVSKYVHTPRSYVHKLVYTIFKILCWKVCHTRSEVGVVFYSEDVLLLFPINWWALKLASNSFTYSRKHHY